MYPNGNTDDNGSGYLSLYVAIDKSTLASEVYADLRFYIFNNNERYRCMEILLKAMWGFSEALPSEIFRDKQNGYLYDGNHCEFGVDVTISSPSEKSEICSASEKIDEPKFTWGITKFSTLLKDSYLSDLFTIGGKSWYIKVYPNGVMGDGQFLSMYLAVNSALKPYDKIYILSKLRVLNQRQYNNTEKQLNTWYMGLGYGDDASTSWGFRKIIPLDRLRNSTEGFVVNMLNVQVEIEAVTSTTYFP